LFVKDSSVPGNINTGNIVSNDNWGEPVSMEHNFSVEEILDMPTEGEVLSEPTLTNIDCVGQDSKIVKQVISKNLII